MQDFFGSVQKHMKYKESFNLAVYLLFNHLPISADKRGPTVGAGLGVSVFC